MKLNKPEAYRPKRAFSAQSMVEFALVLPVVLMIMFGIIELGRLVLFYASVTTASREAARFGTAVGNSPRGIPRYLDCSGIRDAARKTSLLDIPEENIIIEYDSPDNPDKAMAACGFGPGARGPSNAALGDRIIITVNLDYETIIPIPLVQNVIPIEQTTARTIIKDVAVGVPVNPPTPTPAPRRIVYFRSGSHSDNEGVGVSLVTVDMNYASAFDVVVPYVLAGSATEGQDYTASPVGQVVIPAGSLSADIKIFVTNDNYDEPDETVVLTLLAPPAYAYLGDQDTHTFTIIDNDAAPTVQWDMPSQIVPEETGKITVHAILSNPSGFPITVPLTAGGTATNGVDYNLPTLTITIPPYTQDYQYDITVVDDPLYEPDETIILTMGTPTNATLGSPTVHTAIIKNVLDKPPIVSFTVSSQVVNAGDDLRILVHLNAISGMDVSVDWTENAPGSWKLLSVRPLVIPAGQLTGEIVYSTKTQNVGDVVTFNLSNTGGYPVNATLGVPKTDVITVVNYSVSFSVSSTSHPESFPRAYGITVTLSMAKPWIVSVPFTLSGSASNGTDYTISGSPVTFAANSTTAYIMVAPIPDNLYEGDESIVISLGTPTAAGGNPPPALGNILVHDSWLMDDDEMPTLSFNVASSSGFENDGPVAVRVDLSAVSGKTVRADMSIGGTAINGTDYTITPTQIIVPAGSTYTEIMINPINNTTYQGDRTVQLTIGQITYAVIGSIPVHVFTIKDDDSPTCNIYAPNSLGFQIRNTGNPSSRYWRIYWTGIQNLDTQYTVILSQAQLIWPTTGGTAPNLTAVYWDTAVHGGTPDWTGSLMAPDWIPTSGTMWSTSDASRTMTVGSGTRYVITFDMTRDLLPGSYQIQLLFKIAGLNVNCQMISSPVRTYP